MRPFMNPPLIPRTASRGLVALLAAAAALGLVGCLMRPSFAAKITTADGVLIEVPLSTQMPEVSDDAMTVNKLLFTPWTMDKSKGLAIAFQVAFKAGAKPVTIAVDDVSDEPILNVYTDRAPVLSSKGNWNAVTPPHNPADEYAKWIMTLDNTIKVYRFTVKLADGTTHVLRYAIFVAGPIKGYMRSQLGVTP